MSVIALKTLGRYTAFTTDGAYPPTFTFVFAPDDVVVLPYAYFYCAGWNGTQIVLKHRMGTFYINGDRLNPLLKSFEYLAVRTVHVFDPERYAPVSRSGATVVTRIDLNEPRD